MSSLVTIAPRIDDDDSSLDETQSTGGPIAALVIAVPVSVFLWGIVFAILFTLIH